MSATGEGNGGKGDRATVTVLLPRETADRVTRFCLDHRLTPDELIDRALREYFREGDMSH